MHRTTTTATLLVTVAVSALSGCVTVQRPVAPGPPATPSLPAAPRPDGRAEPQIVQAPAREALELIGPSREAKPDTPATHRAAPPSAARQPAQQPPRPHPEHPAHPEARHPQHPQHPHVEIPDVATVVPKNPDVCGLGRQYGGWRKDSPEARICEQTYGR
ncbi:hypothetical protein OG866_36945 [Streptomyces sp. NBC_00663]|uniref:hypothetical protein n=1 Tax=Streptomyces sp. NBC_00663 TaxID=2975801 RepID=UPI002E3098D2|nr:hypothetical protein [Streptomyces sp. NBC_00663]